MRVLLNETAGPLEFTLACDILRDFYLLTLEGAARTDTLKSRAELLPIVERALRESWEEWDKNRKAVTTK